MPRLAGGLLSSHRDQLHVATGRSGERSEVGRVAGEDLVTVMGEEDHSGVDDVIAAGGCEQDADSPTYVLIDRLDVGASQQAGEVRLATVPAAPHLPDDANATGCPSSWQAPVPGKYLVRTIRTCRR